MFGGPILIFLISFYNHSFNTIVIEERSMIVLHHSVIMEICFAGEDAELFLFLTIFV